MSNIVFLVRYYHPSFTAVGYCAYCVAKSLAVDHNVTVVSLRGSQEEPEIDYLEEQSLFRVSHRRHDWRLWLSRKQKQVAGMSKHAYGFLFLCLRALEWCQISFSRASVDQALVQEYYSAIQSIDSGFRKRDECIDAIVPTSAPIEAVVAAMRFKRDQRALRLIPYLFDPFRDSPTLHRFRFSRLWKDKRHEAIERDLVRLSSRVLCMHHLRTATLATHVEPDQKHKIVFAEHPLLSKPQHVEPPATEGQLRMVYAGSFNRTVRDPTSLLRLLDASLITLDGVADIYSAGNCSHLVHQYAQASSGRIVDHGFVQKAEVDNAIRRSDILLSVGNMASNLVPSKIFEYISLCKPIVHCYAEDGDSVVSILARYPLSLCLRLDSSLADGTVSRFISFCKESRSERLAFEDIATMFDDARPEFTADLIRSVIASEDANAMGSYRQQESQ